MQRRQFLLGATRHSLLLTSACSLPGCGTLFHSERVGQPHSRDIDWKIAALDGLGLLLFFVPGVIAFVVDFTTGAIYLPLDGSYPYSGPPPTTSNSHSKTPSSHAATYPPSIPQDDQPMTWQGLKRVEIPRPALQPRQIEVIVARETGREISLNESDTRLSELTGIDQYDEQLARHHRDRNFGHSVKAFFSRMMPS